MFSFANAVLALIPRRVLEVTLDNGGTVNAQALFSANDWAGPFEKRIIIPAGKVRGSSNPASPAFVTGSGFGGRLRVSVFGSILGAGASAATPGGDAIDCSGQAGVIIDGNGNIKSGGGKGGDGSNGGSGVYYTSRVLNEGPIYDGSHFWAHTTYWDGTNSVPPEGANWSPPDGSYSYYQGAFQETRSFQSSGDNPHTYATVDYYAVGRQKTVFDVPNYTTGGAKGVGGRGEGYDGARGLGTNGGTGGTNAGNGGKGGDGGLYGQSGAGGLAGSNGNVSNAAAPQTGTLAGYAIKGIGNVTNNFTGTLAGRT